MELLLLLCLLLIAPVEGVLALSEFLCSQRDAHTSYEKELKELEEQRQAIEQKIWQSIWRVHKFRFRRPCFCFASAANFLVFESPPAARPIFKVAADANFIYGSIMCILIYALWARTQAHIYIVVHCNCGTHIHAPNRTHSHTLTVLLPQAKKDAICITTHSET